jgi:CheY-like chemotaxis protein
MKQDHRILLVEDNPDDVVLIERAIRKADIAAPVSTADDGQTAIDYLSGRGIYADREKFPVPSLVLLDIKLPRRTGLEVLHWVRQHSAFKKLVIVMLTSSREVRDVDEAYALGANSYLVKPIAPLEMQQMIKTLGTYWLSFNEPPPLSMNA